MSNWIAKIKSEKKKDEVIQDASRQLMELRRVVRGQLKKVAERLGLRDGTMYFDERLVIPRSLRVEAIRRTHKESHFGQHRMMRLMKRSYFWVKIAQDVKSFCRDCLICQKPSRATDAKVC